MRIATWNVNSVRQRLPHLLDYLGKVEPDVLCLQELKCVDESFPRAEVEAAGYHAIVHGQKGFNGVAILTRADLAPADGDVLVRLPGDEADVQARYLEAVVRDAGGAVRVASSPSNALSEALIVASWSDASGSGNGATCTPPGSGSCPAR